jgi:hypothetical protein
VKKLQADIDDARMKQFRIALIRADLNMKDAINVMVDIVIKNPEVLVEKRVL